MARAAKTRAARTEAAVLLAVVLTTLWGGLLLQSSSDIRITPGTLINITINSTEYHVVMGPKVMKNPWRSPAAVAGTTVAALFFLVITAIAYRDACTVIFNVIFACINGVLDNGKAEIEDMEAGAAAAVDRKAVEKEAMKKLLVECMLEVLCGPAPK